MNIEINKKRITKLGKIRSWFLFIMFVSLGAMSTIKQQNITDSTLGIISIICAILSLIVAFVIQINIVRQHRNLEPPHLTDIEIESKKGTSPEQSVPALFTNNSGINPLIKIIKVFAWIVFYILIIVSRSSITWDNIIVSVVIGLGIWIWSVFRSISLINFTYDGVHFLSAGYAKWQIGRAFHIPYKYLKVKQEPISIGIATNFYNNSQKSYTMLSRFWSSSWQPIHDEMRRRLNDNQYLIFEKEEDNHNNNAT